MNPEQILKERCPECGAEPPLWKRKDKSQDWGPLGVGPRWHCKQCDAYRIIVPFNADDHAPTRGSAIETWLEKARDARDDGTGTVDAGYQAIDELLGAYRDMADNSRTLGRSKP